MSIFLRNVFFSWKKSPLFVELHDILVEFRVKTSSHTYSSPAGKKDEIKVQNVTFSTLNFNHDSTFLLLLKVIFDINIKFD